MSDCKLSFIDHLLDQGRPIINKINHLLVFARSIVHKKWIHWLEHAKV